jgi:uncharacterized delta-60 repeat protein
MHSRPVFSTLATALFLAVPALGQIVHDASADFSVTSGNPNGVWSYGRIENGSSQPLVLHTVLTQFETTTANDPPQMVSLPMWRVTASGTQPILGVDPSVAVNNTTFVIEGELAVGSPGQVNRLNPGELFLHPGNFDKRSVIRFTAPAERTYRVKCEFFPANISTGVNVHVSVVKGSTTSPVSDGIFLINQRGINTRDTTPRPGQSRPSGPGTGVAFDYVLSFVAGENIDFRVGSGAGAANNGTGMTLSIAEVQPPTTLDTFWLGGSGNWSDSLKWTFGTVPNNNQPLLYSATIDVLNPISSVNINVPVEVQNLTLGVPGNNTFSGVVSGAERLTVHDTLNWHRGSMSTSALGGTTPGGITFGGITFGPSSTVNVAATNGATQSLSTNILNKGNMTVAPAIINGAPLGEGSARLVLAKTNSTAAAPVFTNEGTFTLHGVADLLATGNGGGSIINNGTFIKSGLAEEDSRIEALHTFTNNGLIQVDGGILTLPNGTHQGTYQLAAGTELRLNGTQNFVVATEVNGAGTLAVTGGTTTANAPLTIHSGARIASQVVANAEVDFHGPLAFNASGNSVGFSGPADIRIHGVTDWQRGWLFGAGLTIFSKGSTTNVAATGGQLINDDRHVINRGTMNIAGAKDSLDSNGNPVVPAASRFDIRNDAILDNEGAIHFADKITMFNNGEGSENRIVNTGLVTKTGADTTTTIWNIKFNNTGRVEVISGTLDLDNIGTHVAGEFAIATGGQLVLRQAHTADADTTFTGDGELQISADTVFNGNIIEVPSVLQAGILSGPSVTFDRDVVWSGGRMHGSGIPEDSRITIFSQGCSVEITGAGVKLLDSGRTLRNLGTITMDANFGLAGSSRLVNEGQFTVNGGPDFGNQSGTIVNMGSGTFTKNGAPGDTTTMSAIPFENSGRVEVKGGTLSFDSSYAQNSGILLLDGGQVTSGSPLVITGGSVQGGGTITGAVSVSGGTMAPGIDAVPGVLAITGDLTLTSSSKLSFDIGGTTPGTGHDQITEAGSTALNLNGSTLELGHLNAYLGGTVTILSSNAAITGSFGNVADNQRIKTKDGKGTFRVSYPAGSFSVQLNSFQAAPFDLTLAGDATVTENLALGTVVGTLSASSVKANPFLEFTLVSGAGGDDNSSFQIVGNQLQVRVPLDFESGGALRSVRVRVTDLDNGEFIENVIPITVLDVPSPTIPALSNATIRENLPPGTVVGDLSALPAEQAPFTFALVSGTGSEDNARFTVDGSALKIAAPLDYEATPGPFSARVRVTNAGGETLEQVFGIQVEDVAAPVDLQLAGQMIAENTPPGALVGTLSATDATDLTFSLVAGTGDADNARFQIVANQLQRSAEPLDFETQTTATIRVRVTNEGGETLEGAFGIQVLDMGPASLGLSHLTVPEAQPLNTVVGTLSVPGAAPEAAFTYSLADSGGFPNNFFFNIQGDQLRTSDVFDFDNPGALKSFDVRIRVTDAAGEPRDETFTITLTDTGPTDVGLTPASVPENLPAGTVIGQLSAPLVPEDPLTTPVFSFPNPPPGLPVAFGPDNRSLVTTRPLSAAETPTITLDVRAEHLGETFDKEIIIQVTANPAVLRVDHPFDTSLGTGAGMLDLGDIPLGETRNRFVVLRNEGPAHIFNIGIQNPVAPNNEANATSTDLAAPRRLAPGEAIGVQVVFSPNAIGQRSSVILFQSDNVPDYPLTVTANVMAPNIVITDHTGAGVPASGSPVNLGLGLLQPGVLSRTFTVRNTGNAPLENLSASVIGSDAAFFTLSALPTTLAGSWFGFTTLTITYSPLAEGIHTTTLRILSNDPDSPTFDIPLTAQGVSPIHVAQTAYVKDLLPLTNEVFGRYVAVDGNTAVFAEPLGRLTGIAGSGGGSFPNVRVLKRDPLTNTWGDPVLLANLSAVSSISISADTIAVGDTSGNAGKGRVSIYVRSSNSWSLQQLINAPAAADSDDGFGMSVALDGDRLIVGAPAEDSSATGINGDQSDNSSINSGAAYIYQRTGTAWTLDAYLKSAVNGKDAFGVSVAISGDTVVVGASTESSSARTVNGDQDDNSMSAAGAAYVFTVNEGTWSQQAYLKATNTDRLDNFGESVGISGNTIVVGSPRDSSGSGGVNGNPFDNNLANSGAAHVFVRSGSDWSHQAYLKASNPDSFDNLGSRVSIFGDAIVVGVPLEDSSASGVNGLQFSNTSTSAGAAYVFKRSDDHWVQHAYLKASNTGAGDQFGSAVAVSGDRVVVGAPFEDSSSRGLNGDGSDNSASNSGAAYIFDIIPPEVFVHDGASTGSPRLADNQAAPVDFGVTLLGQAVTRAFTILNARPSPLMVQGINLPAGYSMQDAPAAPIAPNGTATFFIRLNATTAGTFAGEVEISTDDALNPAFAFPVTGEVTTPPPGSLDPRFGGGTGIVRADFERDDDRAYAMVVMPEGKIVLGGGHYSVSNETGYPLLARFHADGSLDTGFGEAGFSAVTLPSSEAPRNEITGLALQDGKLLAATHPVYLHGGIFGGEPSAIVRYLADGSMDPTFGTNGVATDSSWVDKTIGGIQVTATGKILLAGGMFGSGGSLPYVRRLNHNGSSDLSFGGAQGITDLSVLAEGLAEDLILAPNGEIIVGGADSDLTQAGMTLWKLSAAGAESARTSAPVSVQGGVPIVEVISGVAMQPDGKVVFAGRKQDDYALRGPGNGFFAGRMTQGLALDTSFNGTGVSFNDLNPATTDERANSVAVQPDGKIVVAGSLDGKLAVMRFRINGTPDPSFGTDGLVLIDAGPNGAAYKVIVLPDSDILVAGHAENPLNPLAGQDFVLVKILGDVMREPNMVVRNLSLPGAPVITDGQATAVSFGAPRVHAARQRQFRLENMGTGELQIDAVTAPAGYRVVDRPASVAVGASQVFALELLSGTGGVFSGNVTIQSNDTSHGTFTFPVTGTVQPNLPPAFSGFTASTVRAQSVEISIDKLRKAVNDANSDVVNVTSFAESSVAGGTIGLRVTDGSSVLVFKPEPNFVGTDLFSVLFSDGEAEIAGVVSVQVAADPAFNPNNPPVLTPQGGAGLKISFTGIPRRLYNIERSTNLVTWGVVAQVKSNSAGVVTFTDPSPPQPSAFYRISTVSGE